MGPSSAENIPKTIHNRIFCRYWLANGGLGKVGTTHNRKSCRINNATSLITVKNDDRSPRSRSLRPRSLQAPPVSGQPDVESDLAPSGMALRPDGARRTRLLRAASHMRAGRADLARTPRTWSFDWEAV